jgi:hypothetical protein
MGDSIGDSDHGCIGAFFAIFTGGWILAKEISVGVNGSGSGGCHAERGE